VRRDLILGGHSAGDLLCLTVGYHAPGESQASSAGDGDGKDCGGNPSEIMLGSMGCRCRATTSKRKQRGSYEERLDESHNVSDSLHLLDAVERQQQVAAGPHLRDRAHGALRNCRPASSGEAGAAVRFRRYVSRPKQS